MTLLKTPKQFIFTRLLSQKTTQVTFDVVILTLSFIAAYVLRFDFDLPNQDLQAAIVQLLIVVPLQMFILHLWGVNKFIWRYTGILEAQKIFSALLLASSLMLLIRFILTYELNPVKIPISITIFNFCLAAIGLLGMRVSRRVLHENNKNLKPGNLNLSKKSVLLIGAGRAGVMTVSEAKSHDDLNIEIKGFVDDDKSKQGAIINGIKVVGDTSQLPALARQLKIDYVIISMTQATREDFNRILNICRKAAIKVRIIPGLYELLKEKVSFSRIRDIEIEDLLGRTPIQLEPQIIDSFLMDKVVMITGAGGSIGSELVRQLASCQPEKLVLVERSEFALFQIEQEIKERFPALDFNAVIADICDRRRMKKVFQRYNPEVIFHAAAHKHVPMMEFNASEALKNNILGSQIVGQLAGQQGAEAFVLVSTDKAINPTSIMGASKRVAELVIQDLNNHHNTRFVAVRFGNVIGSNGSVVPIFREQIKKGGPVTVTHPEMTRFFMTIPEATQLVMQAGAIGKGGEIFILDMGKPIKILDLAKETIKLSGLRPGIDIKIAFTGIRPGEKLFEELETDKEQLAKTIHPKIFIGKINPYPTSKINEMIEEIQLLCQSENDERIRDFLSFYLPEANLKQQNDEQQVQVAIIRTRQIPINENQIAVTAGSNA
jgi:FlaA1/EpsC-like NDP-sugar epimerase